MEIGLYFGSFNPIHHGHLIIAQHILENTLLKELWFVVSPQNPFKPSSSLLNEHHRYFLVQEAIEGETRMRASNVEFSLPKPSYTADTLAYLREHYPQHHFHLIMGSDSFTNFDKWKNPESILANHPIIIYKRPSFEVTVTHKGSITVLPAPLLEISSTHIRELIRKGASIRYFVPDAVVKEIDRNGYYRQTSSEKKAE
ncbi:MAG: nicotinate-nucleotide adenylyltransferase [Chitinophagaceae bacterium]|nr:MAG: nicotinate-nucleotide adenylyltransferase [Chitinophagaceae bacterium]